MKKYLTIAFAAATLAMAGLVSTNASAHGRGHGSWGHFVDDSPYHPYSPFFAQDPSYAPDGPYRYDYDYPSD